MIGFRCPADLRDQLKDWCFEHHLSVAEVLVEIVQILTDDGDLLGEELRERLLGHGVRFEEVTKGE